MSFDRVNQLKTVSIPMILEGIFQKPVNYLDIGHHDDLRNYVVKVEDMYILKVYGDKMRWRGELESFLRIHQSELRTPSLVDFGMVNQHNGWILMNFLPGEIMDVGYSEMSHDVRSGAWKHLGELLAEFHMRNTMDYFDTKIFEKESSYRPLLYWDFLKNSYMKNKSKIVKNHHYNEQETYGRAFEAIEQWFDSQRCRKQPLLVLCHNDFCTRNILIQERGYGLVDFEMGNYGQPEADFARLALDLKREKLFDSFLDGYYMSCDLFERDDITINMHIYLKIIEICSWAFKRSPEYYAYAFDMLK